MQKSLIAIFVALVCSMAIAKAEWTNWRPDTIGGKTVSYHRLNDEQVGNKVRHFIQFKNVAGIKVHIYNAVCNDSSTAGWCELGPQIQQYGFTLDDDSDTSNWTWASEVVD